MLYLGFCRLSCGFVPSPSGSVPLVTYGFVSGLDGVKSTHEASRPLPILRGGGDDGNQNGTVVAMSKTERWYAIVEELHASAPRLCSYGFGRLRLRPSASC